MPIDPSIVRRIRNLIPDTDAIYGDLENEYLFSEQSIEDFYEDGNSSVKWAAGLAKMAVGGSEALVLKVIKNYETGTDGASLMKQWTNAGIELVRQAREDAVDGFTNIFELNQPDHLGGYAGTPEAVPAWNDRWGW